MANIVVSNILIDGNAISRFSAFHLHQSIYDHHHFSLVCPAEAIDGSTGIMFQNAKNLLGKDISVQCHLLSGSGNGLHFVGVITHVSRSRFNGYSGDIIISGYSPTIILDSGSHCKSWLQQSVKNIAGDVLKHFPQNKLNPKINVVSRATLAYTVQYKETAWGFLKRLAAMNGQWLYYDGSSLILGKPQSDSTINLTFGSNVSQFDLGIDAHPVNAQVMGYDFVNYATYTGTPQGIAQKAGLDELGKHAYQTSQTLFSTSPKEWNNQFLSNQKQLDDYVNNHSALKSSSMVRFEGTGNHPGVGVGSKISVSGNNIYSLSGEDYGGYIITGVTHTIADNNSYSNRFEAVPDSIQMPPVNLPEMPYCETQSAIVTDNHDQQGLGRIRVKFHWMNGAEKSPWIRVTTPHAGGGKGMFFMPEIGEEVIIGFEGDSAVKPFVIGTVYHAQANNSFSNGGNDVKAIQSRSGNKLVLNDSAGSVHLSDQGGAAKGADLLFDGAGNAIANTKENHTTNVGTNHTVNVGANQSNVVKENHSTNVGNGKSVFTMDKEGNIIIDGKKKITFISGDSCIILNTNGDIQIIGKNISINGDGIVTVKGKGSAVATFNDTTVINGKQVDIN